MICSLNHPSAAQPETVNTVTHLISQERLGRGWRKGLGDYSPPSVHLLRAVERDHQKAQAPIPRRSWEGAHSQSATLQLWLQAVAKMWKSMDIYWGPPLSRHCAGHSSMCHLILSSQQHCKVLTFIKHLLYARHFTYIIGFHFSKSPRKYWLVFHPLHRRENQDLQSIIGLFADLFRKCILHAHCARHRARCWRYNDKMTDTDFAFMMPTV